MAAFMVLVNDGDIWEASRAIKADVARIKPLRVAWLRPADDWRQRTQPCIATR